MTEPSFILPGGTSDLYVILGDPVAQVQAPLIDDLRYVCGEIASVVALTSNASRGFAVEDSAAIALRFANGAVGTVTVSDNAAAPWSWEMTSGEAAQYPQRPENCYLIAGTEGSLAIPKLELWCYRDARGWHAPLTKEVVATMTEDPLVRQLRHFCHVMRGEEAPRITGMDATPHWRRRSP